MQISYDMYRHVFTRSMILETKTRDNSSIIFLSNSLESGQGYGLDFGIGIVDMLELNYDLEH